MKTVVDLVDRVEINLLGDVNYYQNDLLNFWFDKLSKKETTQNDNQNSSSQNNHMDTSMNQQQQQNIPNKRTKPSSSSLQAPPLFTVLNSSNKKLSFRFKSLNVRFEIRRGDLLDEKVEAIVNPANPRLRLGGIL